MKMKKWNVQAKLDKQFFSTLASYQHNNSRKILPPIFFGSGHFLVWQSPKTEIRKSGIKFLPPNQFLIFLQNPIGIYDIFLWLKGNLAILTLMVLMGVKVFLRVTWHPSYFSPKSKKVCNKSCSIWFSVMKLSK